MEVLGQEKTYELARLQMILESAVKNPNIVQVPNVLVNGSGGGFEGAAAILGASNLTFGVRDSGAKRGAAEAGSTGPQSRRTAPPVPAAPAAPVEPLAPDGS